MWGKFFGFQGAVSIPPPPGPEGVVQWGGGVGPLLPFANQRSLNTLERYAMLLPLTVRNTTCLDDFKH